MENKIKKEIVNLICSPSSAIAGAILISGGWGVGKTYFWKTQIQPGIESKNKTCIYISLAGIVSTEEIHNKILIEYIKLNTNQMNRSNFFKSLLNGIRKGYGIIISSIKNFPSNFKLKELSFDVKNLPSVAWSLLDLSSAFPNGCVVCMDDIERSGISDTNLLGACLGLQEKNETNVILICNEQKRNGGSFSENNREKLVWKTFEYSPSIEKIYDHFVEKYVSDYSKERLIKSRDTILESFNLSDKNLRVLARCLKDLSEIILATENKVTDLNLKFYCSLYLWLSMKGKLGSPSVYQGHNALRIMSKNSTTNATKVETLTPEETECRDFYKTFYSDPMTEGFSEHLYKFLKSGLLDEEALNEELLPKLPGSAVQLIRKINEQQWYCSSDEEIKQIILQIKNILASEKDAKFDVYLTLATMAKKLSLHINAPVPSEIETALHLLVTNRAQFNDEIDIHNFHFEQGDVVDYANIWIDKYKNARVAVLTKTISQTIAKEALEGKEVNTLIHNNSAIDHQALADALVSTEVLDAIDSVRELHPKVYYTFFFRAQRRISELHLNKKSDHYTEILKERLDNWTPNDESSRKRKKSLEDFLAKS